MNQSNLQLWQQLDNAGLVSGSMPDNCKVESPWYIGALMAFLGFLAALFLLGFIAVGIFSFVEDATTSLILGAFMIGGAYAVLRSKQTAFIDYFSLAISLAGQVLFLWGVSELSQLDRHGFWVVMLILQMALALLMAGTVHRVISAYLACIALMASLILSGAQYIGTSLILFGAVWLWLNEFKYPRYMPQFRSMGYGLVIAMINIKGSLLAPFSSGLWWGSYRQPEIWIQPWVGQLFSGGIFLYLVWQLVQYYSKSKSTKPSSRLLIISLICATIIVGTSFETPGIVIGISILLLGFFGSNRVLIGLGCVSLLFYISAYYYLLDNTLLIKSASLLTLGIVLIACRFCLLKFLPEEIANA